MVVQQDARCARDEHPAQVEFKQRGVVMRRDVADVKDVAFDAVEPIRDSPNYPHKRHYTGYYWAATTQAHVWFESLYERSALMQLDRDMNVGGIAAQPMRFHWIGGPPHHHTPDFFIRFRHGFGLVVDVKPHRFIKAADVEKFARTEQLCARLGWDYRVVKDISEGEARNLRFLSGYRYARWRDARCAHALHQRAGQDAPLTSWADTLEGLVPEPLGAVYSALWWGELSFDPTQRLSLTTSARAA